MQITFKYTTVFDICYKIFPFCQQISENYSRFDRSRILMQNEEFASKVCRRPMNNYVNPFTFVNGFLDCDRQNRAHDLKAVACQQIQHPARASFLGARTLAISRGFLASAISVVTYEILEVAARTSSPEMHAWLRLHVVLDRRSHFGRRINLRLAITLRWIRAAISRCDITCQGKIVYILAAKVQSMLRVRRKTAVLCHLHSNDKERKAEI